MNLFTQVQEALVDDSARLAGVLLKCKLLAARLRSDPLQQWIIHESDGYPKGSDLPDYRIWSLRFMGNFSGYFGSGVRNAPIPQSWLPEPIRERIRLFRCRDSVASLEAMLRDAERSTLTVPQDELAIVIGDKLYEDENCLQAWGEFTKTRFVEALNSVRGRLLNFTIAIEKEFPEVANQNAKGDPPSPERVSQIFNVTVQGSANVVGTAMGSTLTASFNAGDLESLKQVLSKEGIGEADLGALAEAIGSDPKPKQAGKYGPKVSAWMGRIIEKAAQGSLAIGVNAVGGVIAQAIAHYYGFAS